MPKRHNGKPGEKIVDRLARAFDSAQGWRLHTRPAPIWRHWAIILQSDHPHRARREKRGEKNEQ